MNKKEMDNKTRMLSLWEQQQNLSRIRFWCRENISLLELARRMGIHRNTLCSWLKQSPLIRKAIEQGESWGKWIIEDKLFNLAQSGDIKAITFFLKAHGGRRYNPERYIGCDLEKINSGLMNEFAEVIDGEAEEENI